MIQLIYRSAARTPLSEQALADLLACARKNNAALGLTGMLLYDNGSFLQVLEGRREELFSLYTRILSDRRHTDIVKLLEREIDERQFGSWTMGFVSLNKLGLTLPGYSEFLQLRDEPSAGGGQALKVLAQFRAGRFRSHIEG